MKACNAFASNQAVLRQAPEICASPSAACNASASNRAVLLALTVLLCSGPAADGLAATSFWDRHYNPANGQERPGAPPLPELHVLYTRYHPSSGKTLTGRTHGYGHPAWLLRQLDARQPQLRAQGYDPPRLVRASINRQVIRNAQHTLADQYRSQDRERRTSGLPAGHAPRSN